MAKLIARHLSYVADLLPEAHESQPQELETEIEDDAIAGSFRSSLLALHEGNLPTAPTWLLLQVYSMRNDAL